MFHKIDRKKAIKLSTATIVTFFVSLMLFSLLIGITIRNKSNLEKLTMEQLIMEKSVKINEVISKLLYKTQALSALVIQSNGDIDDFERVASTIVDDPAILNVILAPAGVVSHVYPLEGNEALVGFDMLGEGSGNKEAIMAKESGKLVFGGPFELMQGGQALVGRLPVWLAEADGNKEFWGMVSVTLKYPQALDGAALGILEKQGFTYEIWRNNPDTDEKQIISSSNANYDKSLRYIEKHIPILNADWYFRISPVREWYEYSENWILIFSGLCISLLIAFIVQNNTELKYVKNELEDMVNTDTLTEIFNRKGLFIELEKLIQSDTRFQLYYLDLNYFKQINDTYGHNVGDYVLSEFSNRMKRYLDHNYIFARISGDEFILVRIDNPNSENVDVFWEKVYKEFEHKIVYRNNVEIKLCFSKGMAAYPDDGRSIDEIIYCADKRMYLQKNEGRR